MEKKQNLGNHPPKKSSGQPRKKNGSAKEGSKKGNSTTPKPTGETLKTEVLPKTEEMNEKKKLESFSDAGGHRRPCIIPGRPRKKEESAEIAEGQTLPMSKSASQQPKIMPPQRGRSTSPKCTGDAKRPPNRSKSNRRESSAAIPRSNSTDKKVTLNVESTSLLPQAIQEQEEIIKMLRSAREEIREKIVEKTKSKLTVRTNSKDDFAASEPCPVESFQNSYSGALEEIFQAWMNLFYVIINLNLNLVRVVNSAGTEPFSPRQKIEQDIVGQAIECLKFYSTLKMKTVMNSLEELHVPEFRTVSEKQIKEFEEQASSSFLFGMEVVQEKAKEILAKK